MKRKINIVISILICCITFLSGCTVTINAGIVKKNTESSNSMNEKSDTKNASSEDKEKLLVELEVLSDKIAKAATATNEIQALLDDFKTNNNNISAVYFATESGNFCLSPNQNLPSDYNAKQRPWYQGAVGNKVYYSEYQDFSNGKRILSAAKSVYRNNEVLGVIGIDKYLE